MKHYQASVRIIGFSTDADSKYLSARRVANRFFASLPDFKWSQKLSLLNHFKYGQSEKDIRFSTHYKQKHEHSNTPSYDLDGTDTFDIQQLISAAYEQAVDLVKNSKILDILHHHNINCLADLSSYTFNMLNKSSKIINCSFRIENDVDEENDDNDIADYPPDERADESLYDSQNAVDEGGDEEEQEGILYSTKSNFKGMRIADNINPTLRHSYFKIKIKDRSKYMHKQSAR
ncbi:unnamed protein product [Adineta ricciae]|uniref:Uncharacterized protein n=1 Tax=Adineta ricciae TaxID=249248 RepID=A0A815K3K0_ADIRI|nr:unnamed protein product [Adineta ricciae]